MCIGFKTQHHSPRFINKTRNTDEVPESEEDTDNRLLMDEDNSIGLVGNLELGN